MSQPTPIPSTQADTFAYTEVEAASIATLARGSREFLHTAHPEAGSRDLERITKRGLRVHLRPTLFSENVEFCKKFEGILNKCSLDIITLTIEYIQKELATVSEQVHTLETQLLQSGNQEEFTALKAQIESSIQRFRLETEERKRDKFLRDAEDYVNGRVYRWTPGRPNVSAIPFRGRQVQAHSACGTRRK
ncbi:hypothetical protein XELAEV_18035091mg, partial [Xenopus laevis]